MAAEWEELFEEFELSLGQVRNRVRRLELSQGLFSNPQVSQDIREIGQVRTSLQFNAAVSPNGTLPENTLYLFMDSSDNHLKMVSPYSPRATLNAAVTAAAASFVYVSTGDPFGLNERILVDTEQMLITAIDTGTNTLTVTRGVNGTTAAPHAAATLIAGLFDLSANAGGSGGAPNTPQYLVLAAHAGLAFERVFTPGTALGGSDGGAGGAYTLNHAQVSSGDLHQDYLLASGSRAMTGDLRLAAAGSIEDSGSTNRITLTAAGEGLLSGTWRAGSSLEIDGALDHDGTTAGFFNTTPTTQPSAYTQTYVTADKTHAAFTSADLGAFTGGTVGFLDAAERDNVRTQFNALRADVADAKQLVNSVIDDLQALGLVA